jgi:hypothetical protein
MLADKKPKGTSEAGNAALCACYKNVANYIWSAGIAAMPDLANTLAVTGACVCFLQKSDIPYAQ